jgi:thiol-disulfide isomerase/thioredoxin
MRPYAMLAALLLLCGCLQPTADGPTTTSVATTTTASAATATTLEDYAYVLPTNPTTTTAAGATKKTTTTAQSTPTTLDPTIRTFNDNRGPICTVDGKPVVRMYSRSDCEHCMWSGPIFDKVVKDYVARDEVVAYHWVFDQKDDLLTEGIEGEIPEREMAVFFGANQSTVPYFSFGCRFTRSGNGYYVRNQPDLEEEEYRAVIEQLKRG